MIVANLTTIIANLALARSINYNRKVRCKLKCTFRIVNYNPKPFIVQATGLSVCNAATGMIKFGWLWLMWHALYLIGSDHPCINNTKCTLNISTSLFWGAVKTTYTFSAFLTPFPRFRRICILRSTSRRVGLLYVSGALQRTYTLFYPRPLFCEYQRKLLKNMGLCHKTWPLQAFQV